MENSMAMGHSIVKTMNSNVFGKKGFQMDMESGMKTGRYIQEFLTVIFLDKVADRTFMPINSLIMATLKIVLGMDKELINSWMVTIIRDNGFKASSKAKEDKYTQMDQFSKDIGKMTRKMVKELWLKKILRQNGNKFGETMN